MEVLLFGGAQSVGKSESIYRLTQYLLSKGYRDFLSLVPPVFADFSAILEGVNLNGVAVRIIINTATDTPNIISGFKTFYDKNGRYDVLISSVRDEGSWPRPDFFSIMAISPLTHKVIEIPLAKITRRSATFYTALAWYQKNIDAMAEHVISLPPFSL